MCLLPSIRMLCTSKSRLWSANQIMWSFPKSLPCFLTWEPLCWLLLCVLYQKIGLSDITYCFWTCCLPPYWRQLRSHPCLWSGPPLCPPLLLCDPVASSALQDSWSHRGTSGVGWTPQKTHWVCRSRSHQQRPYSKSTRLVFTVSVFSFSTKRSLMKL